MEGDGWLIAEVVWSQGVAQLGVRTGRPGGVQAQGGEEVVDDSDGSISLGVLARSASLFGLSGVPVGMISAFFSLWLR